MRYQFGTSTLVVLASLQAACSSAPTPEPEAPAPAPVAEAPAPAPAPPVQKPSDNPARSEVTISDEIRTACGISETDAHFSYNSSKVSAGHQNLMKKLAECFTVGKLKGRTMRLAGHADPRGEPEYNMVLGGRRADNVAAAIEKAGLPSKQVTTTSRGELEAQGTDEASWARDRRVEIHVAAPE